jgi:hypothetical protein
LPDILGWPWLNPAAPGSADGIAQSIPLNVCTTPGLYQFTHLRNRLNGDEADWVPANGPNTLQVAPGAPPSLTGAAPLGGYLGTTVSVTITGTNLCGVSLSSNHSGLTFPPVPVNTASDGTSVVVQVSVAPGAIPGPALIHVHTYSGSTSFTFHAGGVPMPVVLRKEYIHLGDRLLAVESP